MKNEVISAISTPAGTGGVAVIRMSGDDAPSVAAKIFAPSGKVKVSDFEPNRMYTGEILCGSFSDFGMCVCFKAPKSFTGENVVELHCHGGAEIARAVLKATTDAGARLAERGEFTKRAFINGKLSLSSAEGMIDMINAESLAEIRAGALLYREKLTDEVCKIQERLKTILAGIAADIDYPEEDVAETELVGVCDDLEEIEEQTLNLLKGYDVGRLIKSGATVAICGAPNVGKSSLLNALLGYDKAIVSPVAGTTRDAVEGTLIIDGLKYNLVDTAGIREAEGEIERVGIARAKSILEGADVVLCLSDRGDFAAAAGIDRARLIKVFSMTDLHRPVGTFDIALSAKTGEGIEELKHALSEKATGGKSLDGAYLIEERHRAALLKAKKKLREAIDGINKYPLDLISLDIREAWRAFGEITGETADDEIIATVFSKFCVGK